MAVKRKYLQGDPRSEAGADEPIQGRILDPDEEIPTYDDSWTDAPPRGNERQGTDAPPPRAPRSRRSEPRQRPSFTAAAKAATALMDDGKDAVRAGARAVRDGVAGAAEKVAVGVDQAKAELFDDVDVISDAVLSAEDSDFVKERTGKARERHTRAGRTKKGSESWDKREHWGYKTPPVRKPKPRPTFVPPSEYVPMDDMLRQIAKAEQQYIDGIAKSKLFSKQQEGNGMGVVAKKHQHFAMMMMFAAVQPLAEGVTAANIARTIGLSMMMWKLSPDFKSMVGQGKNDVKDALGDMTEGWLASKAGEHAAKGKLKSSEVWQARLERVRSMRDGDRLPFTAHSAALAEVALGDRAYEMMRTPGADLADVQEKYRVSVEELYAMADYDGVSAEEVSRSARIIVGQRLLDDPHMASRYRDLAYGDFAMAGETDKTVSDRGRTKTVRTWNGEFEHVSGAVIDGGTFSARPPVDATEHYNAMSSAIANDLRHSVDVDEVHGKLVLYGLGWAGMPSNGLVESMGSGNPARRRLHSAMSMMQAMADDGIPVDEAQLQYRSAFMTALQEIEQENPGVAEQWDRKYGDSWRQTIVTLVNDPGAVKDFWKQADQHSRGESRSTAGPRGTYSTRDHQSSQTYPDARTAHGYPMPGETSTSPADGSREGWSGAAPSNEVVVPTRPTPSAAYRAEMAKRNLRMNEDQREGLRALGPGPDITGAGFDPPEEDRMPDEPSP